MKQVKKEEIKLIRSNSNNHHFKELTKRLDEELWGRYGEQQAKYHAKNQLEKISPVLLVFNGDESIACGCFREFTNDGVAEIKRMYVRKMYRGRGISKLILEGLENWAQETGFHSIVLETGILQHEAIGLYKRQGYFQIKNYGNYQGIDTSICFSKRLKQI